MAERNLVCVSAYSNSCTMNYACRGVSGTIGHSSLNPAATVAPGATGGFPHGGRELNMEAKVIFENACLRDGHKVRLCEIRGQLNAG